MEWTRLLSTKRQRQNRYKSQKYGDADLRSEFEKDYHRIIGSASFRRLQDKTQVFPLDKSDFIRTRLTHSMEVSSLAKSLGQNIGESILVHKKDSSFTVQMKEDICNILQCAGLIHDIGNPPFGHYGEAAIREWFERNLPLLTYHGTSLEELLEPQMREDFYHFEEKWGAWTSGVNLVSQVACIIILSFGYSLKYIESGNPDIFYSPALYLYCAISTIFIFLYVM